MRSLLTKVQRNTFGLFVVTAGLLYGCDSPTDAVPEIAAAADIFNYSSCTMLLLRPNDDTYFYQLGGGAPGCPTMTNPPGGADVTLRRSAKEGLRFRRNYVYDVDDSHTITPDGHDAWEKTKLAGRYGDEALVISPPVGEYRWYCEEHPTKHFGIIRIVE